MNTVQFAEPLSGAGEWHFSPGTLVEIRGRIFRIVAVAKDKKSMTVEAA